MIKALVAFFLGLFYFVVFMFVGGLAGGYLGDMASAIITGIVVLAYFFICQFLLSRGHPQALFQDWPIMLTLNATNIILFVRVLAETKGAVFPLAALGLLFVSSAGTLGGAFVASQAAKRRGRQLIE
ncbi:MAG: hypothetical protein QHH43_02690 [Candidatus Saccharicenans sp.]|jgi:uncharacterized membrane protein (UPF0136 family)|nr:hypothetical protein [Candidatus Saccharicenans sp.]MDH7574652.1 hypothetical protein [Candidatus Saccharicenans sp.]